MELGYRVNTSDPSLVAPPLSMHVVEGVRVPRVVYGARCLGPNDRNRDDYLKLLAKSERYRLAGNFEAAANLLNDAGTLLEEQWSEIFANLVTTAGKTFWVDKLVNGSAYTAAWYMGLKGTGTAVAADTLASHASWSEINPYSGNRPAITWGSTTAGSNTASAASFTMTAATTIYGAFLCTVNTGNAGTLYSVADLGTPRGVGIGDVVQLTPTLNGT